MNAMDFIQANYAIPLILFVLVLVVVVFGAIHAAIRAAIVDEKKGEDKK